MSREALAAGQALGRDLDLPVSALLLGDDTSCLSHSLESIQLDEILQAEHPLLRNYSSDGFSQALAQVIESESPQYVIAGHTYMVRDFFPRVSAKLNVPFLADNIAYRADGGSLTLIKQIFAAKLVADVVPAGGRCIISFQSAAFQEEDVVSGPGATVREVAISLEESAIRADSEEPFQEAAGAVDLSSAEVIVSVGRGIGKEENLPVAKELSLIHI